MVTRGGTIIRALRGDIIRIDRAIERIIAARCRDPWPATLIRQILDLHGEAQVIGQHTAKAAQSVRRLATRTGDTPAVAAQVCRQALARDGDLFGQLAWMHAQDRITAVLEGRPALLRPPCVTPVATVSTLSVIGAVARTLYQQLDAHHALQVGLPVWPDQEPRPKNGRFHRSSPRLAVTSFRGCRRSSSAR